MNETYVTVDLDAICHNLQVVAERTGAPICGVIKADAYGHGAVPVAKALSPDCAFFGVSSVEEAIELQNAGLTTPILLLGHTSREDYPRLVAHGIRPVLFSYQDGCALSAEAVRQGKSAPFHFAVDTGMSRIGFSVSEAAVEECLKIAALPNLEAEGIFSHFAKADEKDLSATYAQQRAFDSFLEMLSQRGLTFRWRHLNNSAGAVQMDKHYDMVRAGILLYGLVPDEGMDLTALDLRPALSWYCKIACIKELEVGRGISYGGTYVTTRPTKVATLAVGYGHGYPRSLSNGFYVLIRGKRAPILGRVCMDQMMVDVTDISDVTEEDLAVLVGCSGEERISVEEIACAAGSFNYEFVCTIARRVPRFYYRNGELAEIRNYLLT